jgi:hypothetical protein
MTLAERELRDAADEAACEVLWHLEHEGEAPAHVLERAESLLRAVGALDHHHEEGPLAGNR